MGLLSNKTILIFGGSGGIGLEAAKRFIKEEARVVISSRDETRDKEAVLALKGLGGDAVSITGDYSDSDFIDRAFTYTIDSFGIPDITVNCAGMGMEGDWLGAVEYKKMEMVMKVNVISPYIVMQKAISLLQENRRPGKIINVGSFRSHHTGRDGNGPVYAASKAAIGWLTESTIRALHKPGNRIGVSLICPGAVNTEMHDSYHQEYMVPSTVAQCILNAALMPDNAALIDMTMMCTEQNPW